MLQKLKRAGGLNRLPKRYYTNRGYSEVSDKFVMSIFVFVMSSLGLSIFGGYLDYKKEEERKKKEANDEKLKLIRHYLDELNVELIHGVFRTGVIKIDNNVYNLFEIIDFKWRENNVKLRRLDLLLCNRKWKFENHIDAVIYSKLFEELRKIEYCLFLMKNLDFKEYDHNNFYNLKSSVYHFARYFESTQNAIKRGKITKDPMDVFSKKIYGESFLWGIDFIFKEDPLPEQIKIMKEVLMKEKK